MEEDRQQDCPADDPHERFGRRMRRTQLVERDEQEDDRGQAARPEPADQRDRVGSKTRADERDGDRDHPHDRQAEKRVGDDGRVEPGSDRRTRQSDPEQQPHEV